MNENKYNNIQHFNLVQHYMLKEKSFPLIYDKDNINYKPYSSFLFEPPPEEPKKEEEIYIPLPIQEINESYHITKLRQINNKKKKTKKEKNKEKIPDLNLVGENNLFNICSNNILNKNNFININTNKSGQNNENIIEIKENGENYNINLNNGNNNLNKSFNSSKIMNTFEKINIVERIQSSEAKDDFEIYIRTNIMNL